MIRLGITDLSFHHMAGALVTATLELRGHKVVRSYAPHVDNFEQLRQGNIDMIASAWLPSSHGIYKAMVEEEIPTCELGLHYEPYTLWGVPEYVPLEEVEYVADLLKPAVSRRMTSLIQGIGEGAGITRFSRQIMAEYGLENAGYHFQSGTEEQCFAAFEQAVDRKSWVVVPLWHPQYLHARYRIRELKEPKGLLGGVDRAVLLVREDRMNLLSDDDISALDQLRFGNSLIEQLDYRVTRLDEPLDEVARRWLTGELMLEH